MKYFHLAIAIAAVVVWFFIGYASGKRSADRWYAKQGTGIITSDWPADCRTGYLTGNKNNPCVFPTGGGSGAAINCNRGSDGEIHCAAQVTKVPYLVSVDTICVYNWSDESKEYAPCDRFIGPTEKK